MSDMGAEVPVSVGLSRDNDKLLETTVRAQLSNIARIAKKIADGDRPRPTGLFDSDEGKVKLQDYANNPVFQTGPDGARDTIHRAHIILNDWNKSEGADFYKDEEQIAKALEYAMAVEDRLVIEHNLWLDEEEDDEDEEREGEGNLYAEFTKEDWWRLAFSEVLERMQRPGIVDDDSWLSWGLDNPISGVEVPALAYLKKTTEGRELWDRELKPFIEACQGLDKAGKLWQSCTGVDDLLWRLGYSQPEQQDVPLEGKIRLDPQWLETLSRLRENMGEKIGLVIGEYIKQGEKVESVFRINNNLKWFEKVEEWEKLQVKLKWKKRQDGGLILEAKRMIPLLQAELRGIGKCNNIFDGSLTQSGILKAREGIRNKTLGTTRLEKVGPLAEELAMRIFTLFGGAAAYNFSGFGNDPLSSSMYPNALRWQFFRTSEGADPAPIEIAGLAEIPQIQPFFKIKMLSSYFKFTGEVPLVMVNEDGDVEVDSLYRVLKNECFDCVAWNELPGAISWNVWVGRVIKISEFIKMRMTKADQQKIFDLKKPNALKKLLAEAQLVALQERMIPDENNEPVIEKKKTYNLSDGGVYELVVPLLLEGDADKITQRIVYQSLIAAINGNTPRHASAGDKTALAVEIKQLVENVEEHRILTGDYLKRLKEGSYLFWTQLRAVSEAQTRTQ